MRALLLIMLALAATNLWAGEVYKSVAPNGTVVYSDVPSGPNAQAIFIEAPQPAHQPPRAASAKKPAAAADSQGADQVAASTESGQASPAQLAKDRAKNCKIARARTERYSVAHRLYRNLPNGKREYLSDAEIDQAKKQAAAAVERWCK